MITDIQFGPWFEPRLPSIYDVSVTKQALQTSAAGASPARSWIAMQTSGNPTVVWAHCMLPATNRESPTGNSEERNKTYTSERWWLRGLDLNQRPSGYEPDELPDCSTPRHLVIDAQDYLLRTIQSAWHSAKPAVGLSPCKTLRASFRVLATSRKYPGKRTSSGG